MHRRIKKLKLAANSNFLLPWKELSLCHKSQFSNTYIFTTKWCKPLIFQTYTVWYNRSHSLKYLRSISLGCWDIGFKIQILWEKLNSFATWGCKLFIFKTLTVQWWSYSKIEGCKNPRIWNQCSRSQKFDLKKIMGRIRRLWVG